MSLEHKPEEEPPLMSDYRSLLEDAGMVGVPIFLSPPDFF
jgi:hypothetical protein